MPPMLPSLRRFIDCARRIADLEKQLVRLSSSCRYHTIYSKSPSKQTSLLHVPTKVQHASEAKKTHKLRPGMLLLNAESSSILGSSTVNGSWQSYLQRRRILGTSTSSEGFQDHYDRTFTTFSLQDTRADTHTFDLLLLRYIPASSLGHRKPRNQRSNQQQRQEHILAVRERFHESSRGGLFTESHSTTLDDSRAPLQRFFDREKQLLGHIAADTSTRQSKKPVKRINSINQEVGTTVTEAGNKVDIDSSYLLEDRSASSYCSSTRTSHTQGPVPMSSESSNTPAPEITSTEAPPAQHKPLVVGLKKPQQSTSTDMASSDAAAALNKEIEENVKTNTASAAPAETTPDQQPKQKKEKAPKQPKAPKAAPAVAPTSPALIDLRVGHILRAIAHPNADSLYVSTIAMGDPEGTEHTQVDEETGKVVRTVCSGLKAYIPLEEMQDRKIIVVANLKPVNMRSIKSAAMVLAASPKQEEGADPHAPDRVVELVIPPQNSEAGDKVYFEGWPYGEGKGPEKVLNPKKKQWEAIQPGFFTSDDLKVGFDASVCDEVEGSEKGNLVVEGKGVCTVKTLKGAVVR